MAIKNVTSTDPFKKPVVKVFKDLFSASKVTNVKFDTVKKEMTEQREDEYIVGLLSRFKQVKNEVGKVDEDYDRLISIIAKEELAFIEILKRLEIIEMKRSHINFITESSINRLLFKLVLRLTITSSIGDIIIIKYS